MVTKALIAAFGLPSGAYEKVHEYRDGKIGFTIVRNYPENIQKLTGFRQDDAHCMFWITATAESESVSKLTIRVNSFTWKTIDHRAESKSKVFRPIEVTSKDDYLYDSRFGLCKANGTPITGEQILYKIFDNHLKPLKPLRGFVLRNNIFLTRMVDKACAGIIGLLLLTIKIFTGKHIVRKYKDEDESFYFSYIERDLRYLQRDEIVPAKPGNLNVLNYQTSVNALISSVIFMLLGIVLINVVDFGGIPNRVMGTKLVWLALPILVLWFFNDVLPLIHIVLINGFMALIRKFVYRSIKV